MAPTETRSIILNEQVDKDVVYELGKPNSTFKVVKLPLDPLKDGQLLIKALYISNDPTQRSWIQKGVDPERMYTRLVAQGEQMRARGIAQIVESKSSNYKVGELVISELYWADYSVVDEKQVNRKVDGTLPLPLYLSILGLTGLTAYFGLLDVGKAKKGDTVVISAASGATGSLAVQIAKAIGCNVIGITGSEEKSRYVKSIGADAAVNYKDPDFKGKLKEALGEKKYCDIYFDNVGGEILDTMLSLTKVEGTIVACGAISGYNDRSKLRIGNWTEIIANRLNVKGFIVIDFASRFGEGVAKISSWIKEGKVKADETSYSLYDLSEESKFSEIPETWSLLFRDEKKPGKLLTKLADPAK